jgi:hypothetical protein
MGNLGSGTGYQPCQNSVELQSKPFLFTISFIGSTVDSDTVSCILGAENWLSSHYLGAGGNDDLEVQGI